MSFCKEEKVGLFSLNEKTGKFMKLLLTWVNKLDN